MPHFYVPKASTPAPVKHTPGPWHVVPETLGSVESASGIQVAQAQQAKPTPQDPNQTERAANARLIAAAPDLLAALENLLHTRGTGCNCKSVVAVCGPGHTCDECVARAAIARATGK